MSTRIYCNDPKHDKPCPLPCIACMEECDGPFTHGAGLFVGAGIPKGERVNTFTECGCCGAYHRTDFTGDCREDSERHWDLPDDARIVEREDN